LASGLLRDSEIGHIPEERAKTSVSKGSGEWEGRKGRGKEKCYNANSFIKG
jgi:hypothetical protein